MTPPPFAPSPPNDLVLPERGSNTARAVTSLALRKLFDWVKTADLPAADPGLAELRAIVGGFLPGSPKTVAALLAAPSVSAPLRLLRRGEGDPALLGCAAVDAARRHLAGAPPPGDVRDARFVGPQVVVARAASPFFLEWRASGEGDLDEFVDALRRAQALLAATLPGVADALERAARVVVPIDDASGAIRIEAHAPSVIGLSRASSTEALASALARATPSALLLLLRELDRIGDDPGFERLTVAASAAVDARLAEALAATKRPSLDVEAREAAFVVAFRALEPFEEALTKVGVGIFRELARRAGYDRPKEEEDE